eukprot:773471-Pleurochrysis_carterae.AAC.3
MAGVSSSLPCLEANCRYDAHQCNCCSHARYGIDAQQQRLIIWTKKSIPIPFAAVHCEQIRHAIAVQSTDA